MGVSSAIFESAGKRTEHFIPGAYSRSNNVTSPNGVSAGNLCILGKSAGGKPFELLEFGSVADAKEELVSGELLNAVGYAFNGSNDYIPQRVFAMRVNNGTQSNLTVKSGSTDILKINSKGYGSQCNSLKLRIDTGTLENSKKISVSFKNNNAVIDNVIQESLEIIGQGENPTVSVSVNSITLSTTSDEGESITEEFLFEDYATVSALVSRINDTEYFFATVKDTDEEAETAKLDTITSKSISENTTLYSNMSAFIEALASVPDIGEIEVLTESTRIVPDNIPFTYFNGGTEGNYTTEEWNKALEELEAHDIQIIATPSTNTDVQALILNHCVSMSSTDNKKERTALFGGALNESDDDAVAKARGFNSALVSYVCDSAKAANPLTGKVESINGAMIAVMLAGIESAVAVNIPLTNKTLKLLGFNKFRNKTSMEYLIKNGVMVCNPDPEDITNFVCIRAVTTYQKSDLIANERSMTREAMFMDRDLRARFKPSVGGAGVKGTSEYLATLRSAAVEWQKNGYIVMSENNENIWDERCVIDGDKIKITYSRYLTPPVNFIFITATNHVYTSETII